jgi:hypothetical protein
MDRHIAVDLQIFDRPLPGFSDSISARNVAMSLIWTSSFLISALRYWLRCCWFDVNC